MSWLAECFSDELGCFCFSELKHFKNFINKLPNKLGYGMRIAFTMNNDNDIFHGKEWAT